MGSSSWTIQFDLLFSQVNRLKKQINLFGMFKYGYYVLADCTNLRSVSRTIMRFKLIKFNKNQMTCYRACFPKSKLWALNFVTEKCVTSRVRLDEQMLFAWNKLNFHILLCVNL